MLGLKNLNQRIIIMVIVVLQSLTIFVMARVIAAGLIQKAQLAKILMQRADVIQTSYKLLLFLAHII